MVICLERGADLHTAQLMPLPLTVCCFSKIQIGFTFLVPAQLGSPGQRAVKRLCVRVCVCVCHVLHINQVSDRTLGLRLKVETLISALGRRTRKVLETAGVNSGGSPVLLQLL